MERALTVKDQLEIISPTGEIGFYDLAEDKGICNIGRHPDNDIILTGHGIALFHAVIDYRKKPYTLIVLTRDGQTMLAGRSVSPNLARNLQSGDAIEVLGYTVILLESESSTPPPPSMPANMPVPITRPESASPTIPTQTINGQQRFAGRPPDVEDERVIFTISEIEWTVNVRDTVTIMLEIINGGDLIAGFNIRLDGLPPEWVTIYPTDIELNVGDRSSATVTIEPPREPNSRAGAHHFRIAVYSRTYKRETVRGATLNINPYYRFSMGQIAPRRQTISWFKEFGMAEISLTNLGNSSTAIRVDASDEERGCNFEFDIPGEGRFARQTEFFVDPEGTVTSQIYITPFNRKFIGFVNKRYNYTINANVVDAQQTPSSSFGELTDKPFIGKLPIFLMALSLIIFIVWLFWPSIDMFDADRKTISSGGDVTLAWQASPLVNLRLNDDPLEETHGSKTFQPDETTMYELRAVNWLTRLMPSLTKDDAVRNAQVFVTPILPSINTFRPEQTELVMGQSARIFIDVADADQVTFIGPDGNQPLEEPSFKQAIRSVAPIQDADYKIIAINKYGEQEQNFHITVLEPTPTPVPTPGILYFSVNPRVITAGQEVRLQWEVINVDNATLNGDYYPAQGNIQFSPQQDTTYFLAGFGKNGSQVSEVARVGVTPPPTQTPTATPTGTPAPPVIDFFDSSTTELILEGGSDDITLSWSVKGKTTSIVLVGSPGYGTIPGLKAQGNLTVSPGETTSFLLTASNGESQASASIQIKVSEATATATVPPTITPEPSATPFPPTPSAPNIFYFRAESAEGDADDIVQIGSSAGVRRYEVLAGSAVHFTWEVKDADKVELTDYGQFGQSDNVEVLIKENKTFTLNAQREGNSEIVSAEINITVKPRIPPPPENVHGTTNSNGTQNTIDWDFSGDEEYIVGFRVYRADVPENSFSRAAREDELGKSARSWLDTESNPACNKAYFVVAVYLDVQTGNLEESKPSAESWFSLTCP